MKKKREKFFGKNFLKDAPKKLCITGCSVCLETSTADLAFQFKKRGVLNILEFKSALGNYLFERVVLF